MIPPTLSADRTTVNSRPDAKRVQHGAPVLVIDAQAWLGRMTPEIVRLVAQRGRPVELQIPVDAAGKPSVANETAYRAMIAELRAAGLTVNAKGFLTGNRPSDEAGTPRYYSPNSCSFLIYDVDSNEKEITRDEHNTYQANLAAERNRRGREYAQQHGEAFVPEAAHGRGDDPALPVLVVPRWTDAAAANERGFLSFSISEDTSVWSERAAAIIPELVKLARPVVVVLPSGGTLGKDAAAMLGAFAAAGLKVHFGAVPEEERLGAFVLNRDARTTSAIFRTLPAFETPATPRPTAASQPAADPPKPTTPATSNPPTPHRGDICEAAATVVANKKARPAAAAADHERTTDDDLAIATAMNAAGLTVEYDRSLARGKGCGMPRCMRGESNHNKRAGLRVCCRRNTACAFCANRNKYRAADNLLWRLILCGPSAYRWTGAAADARAAILRARRAGANYCRIDTAEGVVIYANRPFTGAGECNPGKLLTEVAKDVAKAWAPFRKHPVSFSRHWKPDRRHDEGTTRWELDPDAESLAPAGVGFTDIMDTLIVCGVTTHYERDFSDGTDGAIFWNLDTPQMKNLVAWLETAANEGVKPWDLPGWLADLNHGPPDLTEALFGPCVHPSYELDWSKTDARTDDTAPAVFSTA